MRTRDALRWYTIFSMTLLAVLVAAAVTSRIHP